MHALARGRGLVTPSLRALDGFELYRPRTALEAVRAMGLDVAGSAYLAGGTDFVARVREGAQPRAVVHLDEVAELRDISVASGTLRIGAGVSHHAGANSPAVRAALPGLA